MFPFLYCRDSCVIDPHRHLISNKAKWKHKIRAEDFLKPFQLVLTGCDTSIMWFFCPHWKGKSNKTAFKNIFNIYSCVDQDFGPARHKLPLRRTETKQPKCLVACPLLPSQLVSTKTQNNMDMWTQSFAFLLDRHNKRWQETSWAMLETESPMRAL